MSSRLWLPLPEEYIIGNVVICPKIVEVLIGDLVLLPSVGSLLLCGAARTITEREQMSETAEAAIIGAIQTAVFRTSYQFMQLAHSKTQDDDFDIPSPLLSHQMTSCASLSDVQFIPYTLSISFLVVGVYSPALFSSAPG